MPQLDTATFASQIFWLVVSFFILWTGLKLMLPELKKVLDARRSFILSTLEKARNLEKEAQNLSDAQNIQLDLARKEALKKVEQASRQSHEKVRIFKENLTRQLRQLFQEKQPHDLGENHKENQLSNHQDTQKIAAELSQKINMCYPD